MGDLKLWGFLFKLTQNGFKRFSGTMTVAVLQSGLNVALLLVTRELFVRIQMKSGFASMLFPGAVLCVLFLVNALSSFWIRGRTYDWNRDAIMELRFKVLEKLYSLPAAYYSRENRDRLHRIVTWDTECVDSMCNALARGVPSLLVGGTLFMLLFIINTGLSVMALILIGLLFGIGRSLNKRLRTGIHAWREVFNRYYESVARGIRIMELTRIRAVEDSELKRYHETVADLADATRALGNVKTAYNLVLQRLAEASGLIFLLVGGWALIKGLMTQEDFIVFLSALLFFNSQVITVVQQIPPIMEGLESLKALDALLAVAEAAPYSGFERREFSGAIALKSVWFGYNGRTVLKGVDFVLDPGATVVLLGSNGAGKSTIVNLILGFYRPRQGILLADNLIYDKWDLRHLRRQIGYVPQNPVFFSGTVLENLTYGSTPCDMEDVVSSAVLAHADEFIRKLPDGYETLIGENGFILSAGERQRLAIARAILNHPQLLILDEPTSYLDQATAKSVIRNLMHLEGVQTRLMITHDPSHADEATAVFLLQDGRLTAVEPEVCHARRYSS